MDTECARDYMGHGWIIYCSGTTSRPSSSVGPYLCALQAAKRRAVQELLFFASVGDLRRCERIARLWKLEVRLSCLTEVSKACAWPTVAALQVQTVWQPCGELGTPVARKRGKCRARYELLCVGSQLASMRSHG